MSLWLLGQRRRPDLEAGLVGRGIALQPTLPSALLHLPVQSSLFSTVLPAVSSRNSWGVMEAQRDPAIPHGRSHLQSTLQKGNG